MKNKTRPKSHHKHFIQAFSRLDQAINNSFTVSINQHKNRVQTEQIQDMYITMADPNLFKRQQYFTSMSVESDHNQKKRYDSILNKSVTEQKQIGGSQEYLRQIVKTNGSYTSQEKDLIALRAYARKKTPAVQLKKLKLEDQTAQNIRQLSAEQIKHIVDRTSKIKKIHIETLYDLYQAKCVDNDTDFGFNGLEAIIFIERFKSQCQNRVFNCQNQYLGAESARMVSKILKSNDTFTVVNLSGNNLTEKGFSYICKALRRNKAIIHLDLKHTHLSSVSLQNILLNVQDTMVSLDLSFNRIGKQGFEALNQFLEHHKTLAFLGLEDCGQTVEALAESIRLAIISIFFSKAQSLVSLNLSRNKIANCDLLQELGRVPCLEELNLSSTSLGDKGLAVLCNSIRNQSSLKILHLEKVEVGLGGLARLTEVIAILSLETLVLRRNNFEGIGFLHIIPELFKSRSLSKLDLSDCNLDSQNGFGLNECKRCKTLKHLLLSGNNFDAETGKGMTSGLNYLEYLDLTRCHLADSGGLLLVDALSSSLYLEELLISDNNLKEPFFDKLIEVLTQNRKIKKIDYSKNQYDYKQADKITKKLDANKIHQKDAQIPKIIQQMRDLQQYDGKSDSIEIQYEYAVQRKVISEQSYEFEKAKAEKILEKEYQKTKKYQSKAEAISEESKKLTNKLIQLQIDQQKIFAEMDNHSAQIQQLAKIEQTKIRELTKKMKAQQQQISQTPQNYLNRIEQLKWEYSSTNRKYQALESEFNSRLNGKSENQNLEVKSQSKSKSSKSKSPKKKQQSKKPEQD